MGEVKRSSRKGAASAVAAVTAASLVVGGSFASPDELLQNEPQAVVQTLDLGASQTDDDGGADPTEENEEEAEEKKGGVRDSLRRMILRMPLSVRALVGLPLWALGTLLWAGLSALWTGVLSPAASALLGWLGVALLALAVFTLGVKAVFPDLPLRKILTRRNVGIILLLTLLCGMLDSVLPFFWDGYSRFESVLRLAGSFVCSFVPLTWFLRRRQRKLKKEAEEAAARLPEEEPEPELTPEQKEEQARRLVLELADSVCPKYR